MADAMVTARMPQSKKDAGGRILASLGTTASAAINDLYDFVISNRALPFSDASERTAPSRQDVEAAIAWANGIARVEPGELSSLSLKEAKRHKLASKGLLPEEDAI